MQSFTYRKTKHITPAGGIILLNPGDGHTGEPADDNGFEYRALYPTLSHMEDAIYELTGRYQSIPFFPNVRVDDLELTQCTRELHQSLVSDKPPIECESLFLWVLTNFIHRYADMHPPEQVIMKERYAVKKACEYINGNFSQGISLTELAHYVGLSRYYLLRLKLHMLHLLH